MGVCSNVNKKGKIAAVLAAVTGVPTATFIVATGGVMQIQAGVMTGLLVGGAVGLGYYFIGGGSVVVGATEGAACGVLGGVESVLGVNI